MGATGLALKDHCGLAAVGKFRALHAIGPYLVRKGILACILEPELAEVLGDVREDEYASDAHLPAFIHAQLDEAGTDAGTPLGRLYGH